MLRILVTGLGGFIGKRIAPFLLDRGFEVVGVGRAERPANMDPRVRWLTVDLFDHAAVRVQINKVAPSHCLNLAWYVEHGKYWRAPENIAWVQASLNLLTAFVEAGGKRFVGAGTCAEYDWSYGYLSEALTPRNAASPFGRCKNAVFEATMAYADIKDISAAWGRIFFLYGPGEFETRLVPHVIVSLLSGREAKTSHGEQLRDFSHVDDVAAALAALVDSDVRGAVNIASGQPVKVRTIVETIANLIGRPDLVRLGAIPEQVAEPGLILGDVRRLREELKFQPRIGLEAGLQSTIAAFREALK
jgi:nucleoside-diphosphate-sugar epimerase